MCLMCVLLIASTCYRTVSLVAESESFLTLKVELKQITTIHFHLQKMAGRAEHRCYSLHLLQPLPGLTCSAKPSIASRLCLSCILCVQQIMPQSSFLLRISSTRPC